MQYYLMINGQQTGPFTLSEIGNQNLRPDSLVWHQGLTNWVQAQTLTELAPYINNTPVPPAVEQKDNVVAGVLAILLGSLGIQYFYIGKTKAGLITLAISLLTCGAGASIIAILTLIQGIIMITMNKADFNRKYVFTTKDFPIFENN